MRSEYINVIFRRQGWTLRRKCLLGRILISAKNKLKHCCRTCHSALLTPLASTLWCVQMESLAGSAEVTLFWHCIFPGDMFSKPRRLQPPFLPTVTTERTMTASAVLFYDSEASEYPKPLYVQYVTPPASTSPSLTLPTCSLSLPGTEDGLMCRDVSAHVCVYRQSCTAHTHTHTHRAQI